MHLDERNLEFLILSFPASIASACLVYHNLWTEALGLAALIVSGAHVFRQSNVIVPGTVGSDYRPKADSGVAVGILLVPIAVSALSLSISSVNPLSEYFNMILNLSLLFANVKVPLLFGRDTKNLRQYGFSGLASWILIPHIFFKMKSAFAGIMLIILTLATQQALLLIFLSMFKCSFTLGEAMVISETLVLLFFDAVIGTFNMIISSWLPKSFVFSRTPIHVFMHSLVFGMLLIGAILHPVLKQIKAAYEVSPAEKVKSRKVEASYMKMSLVFFGLATLIVYALIRPWTSYFLNGEEPFLWIPQRVAIGGLSGILTLGIGDTMASVMGQTFGKHKWFQTSKTIEGTVAFVISLACSDIAISFFFYSELTLWTIISGLFCALLTGALEATSDGILMDEKKRKREAVKAGKAIFDKLLVKAVDQHPSLPIKQPPVLQPSQKITITEKSKAVLRNDQSKSTDLGKEKETSKISVPKISRLHSKQHSSASKRQTPGTSGNSPGVTIGGGLNTPRTTGTPIAAGKAPIAGNEAKNHKSPAHHHHRDYDPILSQLEGKGLDEKKAGHTYDSKTDLLEPGGSDVDLSASNDHDKNDDTTILAGGRHHPPVLTTRGSSLAGLVATELLYPSKGYILPTGIGHEQNTEDTFKRPSVVTFDSTSFLAHAHTRLASPSGSKGDLIQSSPKGSEESLLLNSSNFNAHTVTILGGVAAVPSSVGLANFSYIGLDQPGSSKDTSQYPEPSVRRLQSSQQSLPFQIGGDCKNVSSTPSTVNLSQKPSHRDLADELRLTESKSAEPLLSNVVLCGRRLDTNVTPQNIANDIDEKRQGKAEEPVRHRGMFTGVGSRMRLSSYKDKSGSSSSNSNILQVERGDNGIRSHANSKITVSKDSLQTCQREAENEKEKVKEEEEEEEEEEEIIEEEEEVDEEERKNDNGCIIQSNEMVKDNEAKEVDESFTSLTDVDALLESPTDDVLASLADVNAVKEDDKNAFNDTTNSIGSKHDTVVSSAVSEDILCIDEQINRPRSKSSPQIESEETKWLLALKRPRAFSASVLMKRSGRHHKRLARSFSFDEFRTPIEDSTNQPSIQPKSEVDPAVEDELSSKARVNHRINRHSPASPGGKSMQ
ncbi:hypothetical protein HDU67_003617 [Dinochytrium kinnereticum]|nr:hypothetical protein HDU67_003617 [Dinochytrium kinnereticum]